jgi:predicted transcriptional regulator
MGQITSEGSSPSQGEVLDLLQEDGGWMTSEDVVKKLSISSRVKAAKFLRKLWKFNFLERRKQENSVVLEYRWIKKS